MIPAIIIISLICFSLYSIRLFYSSTNLNGEYHLLLCIYIHHFISYSIIPLLKWFSLPPYPAAPAVTAVPAVCSQHRYNCASASRSPTWLIAISDDTKCTTSPAVISIRPDVNIDGSAVLSAFAIASLRSMVLRLSR